MADISNGPTSGMPGSSHHQFPASTVCDTHNERQAVRRVQGETDSFGCEYMDMCQECYDTYKQAVEEERNAPKYCDYCKCMKLQVIPHRDYDEGLCGPLYNVCSDCRHKENERLKEELDDSYNYHYDWR